MARLIYGSNEGFEFNERTLAHLKIALTAKLRVRESFLLNWVIPSEKGSGRMSLWISPEVPLIFVFHGSKPPQLNKTWLDAMTRSAHGIRGMTVMAEDEAEAYLRAAGSPAAP